jgi:hypothetical protein
MNGWEVSMTANYVTQTVVDGVITDTEVNKPIKGIMQPLKAEEIALKDEGQRAWSWYLVQVRENTYGELFTTQILIINSVPHKIMAKKDWTLDGYREYHVIRDFESVE